MPQMPQIFSIIRIINATNAADLFMPQMPQFFLCTQYYSENRNSDACETWGGTTINYHREGFLYFFLLHMMELFFFSTLPCPIEPQKRSLASWTAYMEKTPTLLFASDITLNCAALAWFSSCCTPINFCRFACVGSRLQRQYLYFCTSKASKLSVCCAAAH